MPKADKQPRVIFESTARADALVRGLAKAITGEEPGKNPLPATLDLRGTVEGSEVTLRRQSTLTGPWVEFRGVVTSLAGGSSLAGAYRDLRGNRRVLTNGFLLFFLAVSAFSAIRDWDTHDSISIAVVCIVAVTIGFAVDRFHVLNRNSERDLLRRDIETVVERVESVA